MSDYAGQMCWMHHQDYDDKVLFLKEKHDSQWEPYWRIPYAAASEMHGKVEGLQMDAIVENRTGMPVDSPRFSKGWFAFIALRKEGWILVSENQIETAKYLNGILALEVAHDPKG